MANEDSLSLNEIIFRGAVGNIVPFFGDLGFKCPSYHNPADFIMEVASGEYGPCVETLVTAVEDGKCDRKEEEINQDISKDTTEENGSNSDDTRIDLEVINTNNDSMKSSTITVKMENNCQNSLLGSSESLDDHCHSFPTSTWTQIKVIFIRTFFSIIRDEALTKLRIISHIAIGILLG